MKFSSKARDLAAVSLALALAACGKPKETGAPATPAASSASSASVTALPPPNPDNNVYFGDVHVHTGWSFDALTNGSKTTPMDAYAWAQGRPIRAAAGPT